RHDPPPPTASGVSVGRVVLDSDAAAAPCASADRRVDLVRGGARTLGAVTVLEGDCYLNRLFSSVPDAASAKPSNVPSSSSSRAARMNAPHATRASPEP